MSADRFLVPERWARLEQAFLAALEADTTNRPSPHPEHTFRDAGTYTVTLTVSNDAGAAGTAEQLITCRQQGPNLRCR